MKIIECPQKISPDRNLRCSTEDWLNLTEYFHIIGSQIQKLFDRIFPILAQGVKMKSRWILAALLICTFNSANAACRNYDLISRQANVISRDLADLRFEVRTTFPRSWSLYDYIQRAEMNASFLYRVTRSGSMPCWQTKSNYTNLQRSVDILRNYFRGFSRRRDVARVAYEWRRFIDSYRVLERMMLNAREE